MKMVDTEYDTQRGDRVKVWDPLVRVFHWLLVASFFVSYVTEEQNYEPHLLAGYTVLGLVVFRILWGFVGPRYARFSDFIYRPARIIEYVTGLRSGRAPRYVGHNPAGGLMIVVMLVTILVICSSGVMLDAAENRSGPLADTTLFYYTDAIKDVHESATDVAVVLIVLHLCGVAASSLAHGENLVRSMITGRKRPLSKIGSREIT